MKGEQQHIIRKQNLKVNAVTNDAFALKRRVVSVMEEIAPKLGDMFDDITDKNEWLKIDSLDITIDGISERELEDKLPQVIMQQIREKLVSHRHDMIVSGKSEAGRDVFTSLEHKHVLALAYFLEHGVFPWWFRTNDHVAFEEDIIEAVTIFKASMQSGGVVQVYTRLKEVLLTTDARDRLIEQFGDDVFLKIVEWTTAADHSFKYNDLEKVFYGLRNSLLKYPHKRIAEEVVARIKNKLLQLLISESGKAVVIKDWLEDGLTVVSSYKDTTLMELFISVAAVQHYLPEAAQNRKMPQEGSEDLKHKVYKVAKENQDEEDENELYPEDIAADAEMGSDTRKIGKDKLKQTLKSEEGSIVSNAGLILVSPFLPELFRQCKVAKENKIVNYNKAIALLHYTVFGNCNYREYDVLLNKVLCGMDESQPVKLVKRLSDRDKKEIDTMLTIVISYWSVLKGTSVAGLREAFLAREGKLVPKYDGWILHVEQKTIDVLVQQIPWTIGMIKLPWMEKMLRTEWV